MRDFFWLIQLNSLRNLAGYAFNYLIKYNTQSGQLVMAQGNYMQWSDLKVWKQAHTLVLEIYSITSSFPRSEIYGITNQLRRASSSVAANIVEGQSRNSTKD